MIADDEDTIRRGMTKYMQLHTDRFSKIYEAENGQEALDILLQYQPQVMLLDVQMPGKSGIEVLQEAKRAGIEPITIILSGYDEFKYAQQALHLGAKEYLLKPVRAADILACINQLTDEAFGTEGEAIEQEFAGQENRSLQIGRNTLQSILRRIFRFPMWRRKREFLPDTYRPCFRGSCSANMWIT